MQNPTRADREPRLLTATELADFLSIPLGTLYQWRSRGGGPRAIRVGKYLRYKMADVDAFLEANADDRCRGLSISGLPPSSLPDNLSCSDGDRTIRR